MSPPSPQPLQPSFCLCHSIEAALVQVINDLLLAHPKVSFRSPIQLLSSICTTDKLLLLEILSSFGVQDSFTGSSRSSSLNVSVVWGLVSYVQPFPGQIPSRPVSLNAVQGLESLRQWVETGQHLQNPCWIRIFASPPLSWDIVAK